MSSFSEATRFRPAPNVHTRALGPEIVLLDFARGEYFALDPVGSDIWRLVERGATLGEIAAELVTRYDVSHNEALRDSRALLGELLSRFLVVSA